MKKSRFSEEQKIRILTEYRSGKTTEKICTKHNFSAATLYNWQRIDRCGKVVDLTTPYYGEASHCMA